MFAKKTILTLPLSLCLIYASSAQGEPSFAKKYGPYLGYEGGYSSYQLMNDTVNKKYTPRFFAGFRPIQKINYQVGFELGYTLPASFEKTNYDAFEINAFYKNFKVDIKHTDFYLTFRQPIASGIYWFLNPGIEYLQRDYKISKKGFFEEGNDDSIYLSTRAGIGHNFNSGLGINLFMKSQIHNFNHSNFSDKKLLIKLNLEYIF